ncbi:MAG: hypothetical protein NT002_05295 [candidate division Zixibacteria bacterium]|nr:hypothetical protein [candidate division Zixibacteria bacterium]
MKQKTLYVLLLAVLFLALAVAGSDAKAPRPVKEGTTPVKPAVAQIARPVQGPATQAAPEQIQPAVPEDISADLLTGEKIDWQVLSSGGTDGNSTNFKLKGTVSQTAVGPGSSTNFKLNSGFWQDFGEAAPCLCKPGDANGSGIHNIQDITYLINFLYKGGPQPTPYHICSGDANCNCIINIQDITYLINFLYKGGPIPCSCGQWQSSCGTP